MDEVEYYYSREVSDGLKAEFARMRQALRAAAHPVQYFAWMSSVGEKTFAAIGGVRGMYLGNVEYVPVYPEQRELDALQARRDRGCGFLGTFLREQGNLVFLRPLWIWDLLHGSGWNDTETWTPQEGVA